MSGDDMVQLTRGDLRALVSEAVEETLLKLGVDVSDPIKMQQDFAYLRQIRTGSITARHVVFASALSGLVAFLGTWLYLGFKAFTGAGGGS